MNCPSGAEEEGDVEGEVEGEAGLEGDPGTAAVEPPEPEDAVDKGQAPTTGDPAVTGDTGASTKGVIEWPEAGAPTATGSQGDPGDPLPAARDPGESGDRGGEMERPKGGGDRDQVSCSMQ